MKTTTLSAKQLKSLIIKAEASLRSLRGALNTKIETENNRRAKELNHLEGIEKLDACLTPIDAVKASEFGSLGLPVKERSKVAKYFVRRPLSGTSEFIMDFCRKTPLLYAKSKSGVIYVLTGDGRNTRLASIGRGSKP